MATYTGRFDRDITFSGGQGQTKAECILITATDESIFCLVTRPDLLQQLLQAEPNARYTVTGVYDDAPEEERFFVIATIARAASL